MNKPLPDKIGDLPSLIKHANSRSDDLTLILTFSGGGTRAAALSYGVLEKLRDTTITINNKKRRLIDEVDLISSVSGGSFTSAYYGLFGDDIFKSYENVFLKQDIQTQLLDHSLFDPRGWVKLWPGFYDRSDFAADYYNKYIFKNRRFKDLRKDAPFIVINATDLSLGHGFSFTNYHFNWICSDLQSYPIARAVAASSAVPVVFSPITIENHSENCNYSPIMWASKENKDKKRYEQSVAIKNYRNGKKFKYLHLVDGGVADNLGVRSILDLVTYHRNNIWNLMKTYKMDKTKKLVFIVVNASRLQSPTIGQNKITPSTFTVLDTAMNIQSSKYNVETMDLLRNQFPQWKKQIQEGRCKNKASADCSKIEFSLIEVNLKDLLGEKREELLSVPTSLELSDEIVDALKQAGADLLDSSAEFQKIVE